MCKFLLLASCLACSSHGYPVQVTTKQSQSSASAEGLAEVHRSGESRVELDESRTLARLLLASNPEASFTPTGSLADLLGHSQRASSKMRSRQGVSMGDKVQLKYFDARGVAETARLLFKLAGEEFEDARYEIDPGPPMSVPGFKAAKEAGDLKVNLNRAPVLVLEDGQVIGQSKSIERYLARKFNFMGKDATEEALVDCIAEHCRDVTDAKNRKGFGPFARNKTDEEKAALRSEWFEKELPSYLERIDGVVQETGSPGFAVGSSLSLADVAIFSLLKDCGNDVDVTVKAAEKCSALVAIADAVKSQAPVAKWLEERPKTMM